MNNSKSTYSTGQSINHSIPNFIAVSLYKLIESRNKETEEAYEHEIKAMNYSILMMVNSMLEGFMQDLLKAHLRHIKIQKYWQLRKTNKELREGLRLEFALYENLIQEIEQGAWSKLKHQFKLIFGKNLDKYVGTKIMQPIHCQFTFRNMLAHGNTIEVEILKDEEENRILEFNKKYESVFQHLIKKKLIEDTIPNNLKLTRIFETKAVDYFVISSIEFLEQLAIKLPYYNRQSKCFLLLKYLESTKRIYDV